MRKIIKRKQPTPLLIVLASFDPSCEGVDHYDPEHPEILTDISSPYYGEQWTTSDPQHYYDTFFKEDGDSLIDYYKEMTGERFWFYPAKIDHPPKGGLSEGVLKLAMPFPHPAALRNFKGFTNRSAAHKAIHDIVKECDLYIDFDKYDTDNDGRITPDEFAIIILNAGYDHSTQRGDTDYSSVDYENAPDPRARFMVHGTSQHIIVETRDGIHLTCFSNVGEHRNINKKYMTIGTPAHELAHNLGAQDLYSRYTPPEDAEKRWPTPRHFSIMSNGNHLNGGNTPSYMDPYQRMLFEWINVEEATEDGVYTIHSVRSGKGNIIKIPTANTDEYYLCEIRLKEGFEEYLSGDDSRGGVVVWHIDEAINRQWFWKAQCVSSNRPGGKRHDLGVALKPREGMERILDDDGNFVKFGPLYAEDTSTSTPYFYKSDDPTTSVFNSRDYCGAASLSYSLNTFPEGVSEKWNLRIDVLDEAGAEMKIKITRTED